MFKPSTVYKNGLFFVLTSLWSPKQIYSSQKHLIYLFFSLRCFWWIEDDVETRKYVTLFNFSKLFWIYLVKISFSLEDCWDVLEVFFSPPFLYLLSLVLSLKYLINQFYLSSWIYQLLSWIRSKAVRPAGNTGNWCVCVGGGQEKTKHPQEMQRWTCSKQSV